MPQMTLCADKVRRPIFSQRSKCIHLLQSLTLYNYVSGVIRFCKALEAASFARTEDPLCISLTNGTMPPASLIHAWLSTLLARRDNVLAASSVQHHRGVDTTLIPLKG
eukprot:1363283-Pyramimonas_sp.AAC.1